ncbi:MAG TPA: recombinase family protein [Stellaceae bacterium]|nr:recombinase family protein [Stellaceae bacterium]
MTRQFVTYQRVSTDKQGRSGLGLEAQASAVASYVASVGGEVVGAYVEVESGRRDDRPELARALAACRKLKATLLIAKLDRLARSVHFISGLMESGVEFCAVDMPFAGRLTIHVLAAVAEHEREMISARTKAALGAAKARGVKLGSPNPAPAAALGLASLRARAAAHAANVLPVVEAIRATGALTLRQIAVALNARGLRTSRGGFWHPESVARLLRARRGSASMPVPLPSQAAAPAELLV